MSFNRNVLDEKYLVQRLVPGPDGESTVQALQPGEYFVLRSKDLFASGTLRAYACSIMTFIESADMPGVVIDDEVLDRMRHLLDYTTSLAEGWEAVANKLPD